MARKKSNLHYIYKTTCNVTGKWYVGMHSTSNLDDGYMGSGKILRYSIRKHGEDAHTKEILEYCNSREELVLREIEIVNKVLISDGLCINLKEGGDGGFTPEQQKLNVIKSNEKQKLLREDIEWVNKKAKKLSESHKKVYENGRVKKQVIDWTGKKHSEETKKLISEQRKGTGIGEANSQYGTCWITKDGANKKINKENLESYLNEGWVKGRK
jgi:hypothetical protein